LTINGAGEERADLTTRPSEITQWVIARGLVIGGRVVKLHGITLFRGSGLFTRTGQLEDSYACPYRAPITHTTRTDGCGTKGSVVNLGLGPTSGRRVPFRLHGTRVSPLFTDPASGEQTCFIPNTVLTATEFGPLLFAVPRASVGNPRLHTITVRRPISRRITGQDFAPMTAQTTGTATIRLIRVLGPAPHRR
jgi:hypothetical protein